MRLIGKFAQVGLCLVWLVGCSGGDDNKKDTAPVTGVVTSNGKAVEGAMVTFYPDEGKLATGTTDKDGKFTLTTYEPNDGAVVGNHKVTISHSGSTEVIESNDPTALKKMDEAQSPIPEKYSSMDTSGLTREVKAGPDNNFEFKLD